MGQTARHPGGGGGGLGVSAPLSRRELTRWAALLIGAAGGELWRASARSRDCKGTAVPLPLGENHR